MTRGVPVPEAAARWVASGVPEELRRAAARGAVPLAPVDHLSVLFILLSDPSAGVRGEAKKAWDDLPETFFLQALGAPDLPEPVLDLVAATHPGDRQLAAVVISHARVSPRILARYTGSPDPDILSRLAANQRALALAPEVVRSLLVNPALGPDERGRIASLFPDLAPPEPEPVEDELPPDLPPVLLDDHAEEVFPAVGSAQEEEAGPQSVYQLVRELTVAQKIRLATLGSKSARRLLVRDTNRSVVRAVIQSPKIREDEIIPVAQDRTTSEEVLRIILLRKDWLKNYQLRLALAQNPKTPLPKSLRLLETLQERDLRSVSKSRNVPSPVSSAATRILARRGKI